MALLMARGHCRDKPFGGTWVWGEHSVLGRERRARGPDRRASRVWIQ